MDWIKFCGGLVFGVIGYLWFVRTIKNEMRGMNELALTGIQIIKDRIKELEDKVELLSYDSYIEEDDDYD